MNTIAIHCADGTAFFVGLILAVAAVWLRLLRQSRLAQSASVVASFTGLALIVFSATPLPALTYAAWLALAATALVLTSPGTSVRRRIAATTMLTVFSLMLGGLEAARRSSPRIDIPAAGMLYVIGDSISAGMSNTPVGCWPELLGRRTGLDVVNLAKPGASTQSARIQQLPLITRRNAWVLVEIGGNDMLGDTTSAEFRQELYMLLGRLTAAGYPVVMFELPLIPFRNGYGLAQRRLAAKYHVALIPKRVFAGVIGADGATVDGLHLSPVGHEAMAEAVARCLRVQPIARSK